MAAVIGWILADGLHVGLRPGASPGLNVDELYRISWTLEQAARLRAGQAG